MYDQISDTLSDQALARLHVRLGTPLTVVDLLEAGGVVSGETEFGLHSEISDMQPDTAMLAIALSCRHITGRVPDLPAARVLRAETDLLVEEYGAMWLEDADREAEAGTLDVAQVKNLLTQVPENLEMLHDLMQCLQAEIPEEGCLRQLLGIFLVQAGAHAQIAEEFLGALGLQTEAKPVTGNVIPMSSSFANDNGLGHA